MENFIFDIKQAMGQAAAQACYEKISQAIQKKGSANIILATGMSQFEMLENLVKKQIGWPKVTMFHLDEYIGLNMEHPASFRKYLKERFVDKVENLGKDLTL